MLELTCFGAAAFAGQRPPHYPAGHGLSRSRRPGGVDMIKNRYFQLVLGTVNSALLGVAYAWSLFVAPIEESLGLLRSQTSLIFTLMMVFFFLGCFGGSILLARFSLRKILIASAFVFFASFHICALAQSAVPFYFAYGAAAGLTTGVAYFDVMNTVNKWFADKIGFASGIMLTGFALGSLLLGSSVSHAISALGWRGTFRMYAFVFLTVLLIMAFTVRLPEGYSPGEPGTVSGGLSFSEVLHTRCFWAYFMLHMFVCTIGVATIGNAAQLVDYTGASARMAVIGTGVIALGNGGCRVLYGRLYYRLGAKATLVTVCAIAVSAAALLLFSLSFKLLWLLMPAMFLAGASYGSVATCGSAFPMEYFGPRPYNNCFGLIMTSGALSSVIGSMLVGFLQSRFGSYPLSFSILAAWAVLACVCFFLIPRPEAFKPTPSRDRTT